MQWISQMQLAVTSRAKYYNKRISSNEILVKILNWTIKRLGISTAVEYKPHDLDVVGSSAIGFWAFCLSLCSHFKSKPLLWSW